MMLSPSEFRAKYPPEKLEPKLPDRPITSLRDLQYVYGRLYTLATAGGGEFATYLTPDQARELIDEEESLVVVRVDLSGDEPRLADKKPVVVTKYAEELVEEVAHCYYDAANGVDHSITHRSGRDKEPEKLAEYAQQRLDRWPHEDAIQRVADEHPDGWIIRVLATLGDDENARETIESEVTRLIDGKTTALLTVQIKVEPDSEFRYPGRIDVLNKAMRAQKLSKLVSKGEATDSSGTAVDMLTDDRTRTVGTAEDPLNYFLGKQLEKFPGFDADEAWRTHPISEDAAVTLMNAETFVDACTYTTFGATVYYLPYFLGRLTDDLERAYTLYELLYDVVETEKMTPVESTYEFFRKAGKKIPLDLRFYVAAVMKHQAKRFDVFGDTMNAEIHHPRELDKSHKAVLDMWAFDRDHERNEDRSAALPTHENWWLLSGEEFMPLIASGRYFLPTFADSDDDQDASADDTRIRALVSVLSGEPFDVDLLLSEYVRRLVEDEGEQSPLFQVASQYAQLCALARAELLRAATNAHEAIATPPTYDTDSKMKPTPVQTDGGRAAARDRKLEQFLEETPALKDDERRGAFLLGALVGQVGGYQQRFEGRSTTVIDQYPIKAVTKSSLKRLAQEVLDRDVVYSRENRMGSTMYAEVVDRLVETVARRDPDEWELGLNDLRFYYALGVAYGMNNYVEDSKQANEPADTTEVTH